MTAISVGRDCELVRPDQTIIRVEAEVCTDTGFYGSKKNTSLNVSYTLEDNDRSNMVYDVSVVETGFIQLSESPSICYYATIIGLLDSCFSPVQFCQVGARAELRVRLRREDLRARPRPRPGAPRADRSAGKDLRQNVAGAKDTPYRVHERSRVRHVLPFKLG